MRKTVFNTVLLLILAFFTILMIKLSLAYIGARYDVDFLRTKQNIIHIKLWRYSFYTHIALSIFALIAGFTQFSVSILRNNKKLHRIMGYIYVSDIVLFAGPSGLIMGFFANGSNSAKTSFVILSLLWIVFTAKAFLTAKQKHFTAHRNWMIRSYALTLSAITLRLFAYFFPLLMTLDGRSEYTLIAWLSWTINLVIAELIIRFRKISLHVKEPSF